VSKSLVLRVLALSVVPTLLRLSYALLTRPSIVVPADAPESLLQSLGFLAASTAPPPVASPLPYPTAWQAFLALAWAANNIAVAIPGRYDGRSAMAAERLTAATANLFTPSGWAFIIWAPIFFGEMLMMLYLTSVKTTLGAAVAPGWCGAALCQSAWCLSFRPSVCGYSLLWVPSILLAATGVFLGVAHDAIRKAGYGRLGNVLVRWPVTLHYGWITAATLVNTNNWISRTSGSLRVKEATAHASVLAAVCVAACVSKVTADPIFSGVIAWALAAVAVDGSRAARGLVDDRILDRVRWSARIGGTLAAALSFASLRVGGFGRGFS
jgi:hypothetical protein